MLQEAPILSPEEQFCSALLSLASLADRLNLPDYASILDALNDGALTRLGLDDAAPVPFTVVD